MYLSIHFHIKDFPDLIFISEEAEVFKVKKSSTSRRIAKQLRKERKDKLKDSDHRGNGDAKHDSDSEDDVRDRRDRSDRRPRKEDEAAKAEDKLKVG